MDLKKENSENIASKKEKMKMVIKEGKDFIQKSSDINCFHSHYERCYFFGRVFVLLEQLVEDFYTTNQELDKSYELFIDQLFRKDNKISEPLKKHDHSPDAVGYKAMHVGKTFKIEEEEEKIINLGFILNLENKDMAQPPYVHNEYNSLPPFFAQERVQLLSYPEIKNLDTYPLDDYPYYFELNINEMAVKKIKSNLEELKNDIFNTSWNSKALHELYDESNVLSSLIGCDLFASIRMCFKDGPITLIFPKITYLEPKTNKDLVIKGVCKQLKWD